jgi:hypothetical protein
MAIAAEDTHMIRKFKSDLRTLEWTDMAEVAALCGFIACMIVFAGLKTGAI